MEHRFISKLFEDIKRNEKVKYITIYFDNEDYYNINLKDNDEIAVDTYSNIIKYIQKYPNGEINIHYLDGHKIQSICIVEV